MRNLKITTLDTIKISWVDKDIIMLHVCFQLLIDFVEKEDGLNHCNYEKYKHIINELKYLYTWWKENCLNIDLCDKLAQENFMKLSKNREFLWT